MVRARDLSPHGVLLSFRRQEWVAYSGSNDAGVQPGARPDARDRCRDHFAGGDERHDAEGDAEPGDGLQHPFDERDELV